MEDVSKTSAGAVAALPDNLLVVILFRVSPKAVCRFKCVSKAWRDLIADPSHCKKLRQAMQGLFFVTSSEMGHSFGFMDLTAGSVVDHAFSFLTERPGNHSLLLLDSCNGLMLFGRQREPPYYEPLGYTVCNPTTKQWDAVPYFGSRRRVINDTYLAFDPAVSSHFHLVQFQNTGTYWESTSVHAYSSETGTWSHNPAKDRENHNQTDDEEDLAQSEGWWNDVHLSQTSGCAFVNGFMHLIVQVSNKRQIVVVDVQGRVRRMIRLPNVVAAIWGRNHCIYLGQSQGYLHCITKKLFDFYEERYELSIWVLQDYPAEEWMLKDTVSSVQLFGEKCRRHMVLDSEVADMHLDCNVVSFFHPVNINS